MEKEFKEEFVPYELALKMKALGFDGHCFGIYDIKTKEFIQNTLCIIADTCTNSAMKCISDVSWVTVPTFSQSFKWFRDEHGLYTSIVPKRSYPDGYVSGIEWVVNICGGNGDEIGPDGVFTHSESESACLERLIEIIEEHEKGINI
jgi:hypothetical protein